MHLRLRAFNGGFKMIDKNTILSIRAYFIACLQQGSNEVNFEKILLSCRKFNFHKDLINFLDEINSSQFVRCERFELCDRDIWECNALNSILKEAKKLKILKKVKRDVSKVYRYDLVKKLIEKMKTNHDYCMLVCNFLANSKLSETPEIYTNLRILCRYWIDCKKVLENNYRFKYQLLGF